MSLIAAVDIGASSGRVLTAHLDNDVPTTREIRRFRNGPTPLGSRWIWPIQDLLDEVKRGLAESANLGARTFGIDTWAVDYAVIEASGTQMGPVYAHRDTHHWRGVEKVRNQITWAEQYRVTGIQDISINTIYQLAGEDPSRVLAGNRMLLVPDFFIYHLTGVIGAEVTNASTTGLMDPRTRKWAHEILEPLNIPATFLPDLHEPGQLIGRSRAEGTEQLSAISVATHDTASAFAGTPIVNRDDAIVISLGTWALVGYEATTAHPGRKTETINLTHELGVEGTVRCLRNVTGMWLFEECRRSWEASDGTPPDPGSLLVAALGAPAFQAILDVDEPTLASPGQSAETILRRIVGPMPHDRRGIVRILLESLIARLAAQIVDIERISGRTRSIIHVVGGASRIHFLMQWLSDATGKEVIAGPVEATSLGNAAVQWCVLGEFSNIDEARSSIARMAEIRSFTPETDRDYWREYAGRLGWDI
jgi:rhamnulokinase